MARRVERKGITANYWRLSANYWRFVIGILITGGGWRIGPVANVKMVHRRGHAVRAAMIGFGLTVLALSQLTGIGRHRLDRILQGEIKDVHEEEVGSIAHVLSMRAPEVRAALDEASAAYRARLAVA